MRILSICVCRETTVTGLPFSYAVFPKPMFPTRSVSYLSRNIFLCTFSVLGLPDKWPVPLAGWDRRQTPMWLNFVSFGVIWLWLKFWPRCYLSGRSLANVLLLTCACSTNLWTTKLKFKSWLMNLTLVCTENITNKKKMKEEKNSHRIKREEKNSQRGNPMSQGYGLCRQKGIKFQINDDGLFIREGRDMSLGRESLAFLIHSYRKLPSVISFASHA